MSIVRDLYFYAVVGYSFCLLIKMIFVLICFEFVCVCFETVFYELVGIWERKHRLPSSIVVWPNWNIIARLPSTVFDHRKFFRVFLCDFDLIDDPMHPQVSLVYFAEIRRRNAYWRTISIWRLSTLTGNRMRLCDFHYSDLDGHVEFDHFFARGYQSRGVVFVYFQHNPDVDCSSSIGARRLYVYDTRFNVRAEFGIEKLPKLGKSVYPIAITCVRRRAKNGKINGWRVRLVEDCDGDYEGNFDAVSMSNTVVDLRVEDRVVEVVSCEDMIYSRTLEHVAQVRSRTKFGCYIVNIEDPNSEKRTFVYDIETNSFQSYRSLDDFVRSDASLREYKKRCGGYFYLPQVLTNRDCVTVFGQIVAQTKFVPPTLRMATAARVLNAIPAVKEMTTVQFRSAIGVDLTGHLGN